MKRISILFAVIALAVTAFAAPHSVSDIPNVHVSDARRYVSNPDGVLSAAAVQQLDTMLAGVWRQTSAEVVVVAVDEIDTDDIDGFATKLFEEWGIGKKDNDNGLLILISKGARRATLRTGYGMEGVLPDAICGRIIRNDMAPHFREGDYDGGTIAAVNTVSTMLTDPEAAAEVRSRYENDRRQTQDEDMSELWSMLGGLCVSMTAVAFFLLIYTLRTSRKMTPTERYYKLSTIKTPLLMLGCIGIGVPLLAYWILTAKMKRVRNSPRKCPNCSTPMQKVDEVHDNDYLTPAQDTEEKIDSVDYDVWLCPNCGEKDIIPFVNPKSGYSPCPLCGARACTLVADRVMVRPTTAAPGRGVKVYSCRNCHRDSNVAYEIPKLPVVPVVILPGGGRGFGGGGGFSGGSFGGGMTGGGGASGGW